MASIVPDYEYDIFISYRQKDNKGERWMSEFVEANSWLTPVSKNIQTG